MSGRSQGRIKSRTWWALVRSPKSLPVLFASYEDAVENRDPDEYIVQVIVEAKNPRFTAWKWSRVKR